MTTITVDQLEAQIETLKRRLGDAESATTKLTAERDRAIAGQELAVAAAAAGVTPMAIPDAVSRGLRTGDWKTDNKGRFVMHRDGYPEFDNLSCDPVTPEQFVKSLRQEAPYYWPDAAASDDQGAAKPASNVKPIDGVENPWMKGPSWNMTKQAQIWVRDPELAERLAAAAGSPLLPRIAGR